jgi:hypothetical protein
MTDAPGTCSASLRQPGGSTKTTLATHETHRWRLQAGSAIYCLKPRMPERCIKLSLPALHMVIKL